MTGLLLFFVVGFPALAAVACALLPWRGARTAIVAITALTLAGSSVALLMGGPFVYEPAPIAGVSWDALVTVADFALLALMLLYAIKLRSVLVALLVLAQAGPLAYFELYVLDHHAQTLAIRADNLALVMVGVISLIGSIIVAFALPYMDEHEHHLKLPRSRQPRFFFFMVLFLGAMNGLVLANNLLWLYFFFEVTTFCSFMLIGHDGTEQARASSVRALWMNSLGGVAFVAGLIGLHTATGTLDLQSILATGTVLAPAFLLPVALVCFAGFTKAAQVPFQSWLLGAMVAPTPVSALLHSSTMVKAGVYVVLRLAPLYAATFMGTAIATCGAFTFLVGAALAVGQSNGKKILAYSTVSNLGLIIACAGLATPRALTAALFLIVFHAASKGLLFLTVGTIEQKIGSRDIEDMWGLSQRMPRTALVAAIGIVTMMAPPFGVLLSKWIALEAASSRPLVVAMMALASALGVLVYTRWAGLLFSVPANMGRPQPEAQPFLTKLGLYGLAAAALVLPIGLPEMYSRILVPLFATQGEPFRIGIMGARSGSFELYPLYLAIALGIVITHLLARTSRVKLQAPYMSGVPADQLGTAFVGPMNQPVKVVAGNYYLSSFFGEARLTRWVNLGAAALMAAVIAGALL